MLYCSCTTEAEIYCQSKLDENLGWLELRTENSPPEVRWTSGQIYCKYRGKIALYGSPAVAVAVGHSGGESSTSPPCTVPAKCPIFSFEWLSSFQFLLSVTNKNLSLVTCCTHKITFQRGDFKRSHFHKTPPKKPVPSSQWLIILFNWCLSTAATCCLFF